VPTQPLRIELELERHREPIQGKLVCEYHETVSFIGWLELMAAIEVALAQPSSMSADQPSCHTEVDQ